jgi:hypothetical protein
MRAAAFAIAVVAASGRMLCAAAQEADTVVVARTVRVENLETVPFTPEDFKFKSTVYNCKASYDDRLREEVRPPSMRGEPLKPLPTSWVCCAELEKIAVVEDGNNLTENRSSVTDCKTVASASGYLTGKFPKVYEVTLNGKKINEEKYTKFQAERLNKQGRFKYRRCRVTAEVSKVLKGDFSGKEIVFETEQGVRQSRDRRARAGFNEREKGEQTLYLSRTPQGGYRIAEQEVHREAYQQR